MAECTSPLSDDPFAFDASLTESERLERLLSSADKALLVAFGEWGEVGKSSAETARCLGCEAAWRERVKNVVRSVVASRVAVGRVKKGLAEEAGGGGGGQLKVEVPDKWYHAWWVVPQVSIEGQNRPIGKRRGN